MTESPATGNKLAIVGAGSAGLIALFYAARRLTGWQIRCFERSGDVLGAWGDPYPGFVSTSTKYTTQFACHRLFDAATDGESARQRSDFFRDGEYGAYLRSFVRHHRLAPYIRLHSEVRRLERIGGRWRLTIAAPSEVQDGATQDVAEEDFDALILATGLAETPKAVPCEVEQLESLDDARSVRDKTVVVLGGGESAADIANRLADPALGNRVLMSLRTGIRVSPRYHPIKGVPSDFLRTRLMLSIHQDLRNAIGQKFVEARIKHQETFERLFRRRQGQLTGALSVRERRKYWTAKLTEKSKDSLFNMFHNKSDDFLDAVAEGRLRIVGPPLDDTFTTYASFDDGDPIDVEPDCLVPTIGFTSNLGAISGGTLTPADFYLGCLHVEHDNLFLVGFARPILGNIPSISEMQAQYATGLLSGRQTRPRDIAAAHRRERSSLRQAFPKLDSESMYPVEMFPYCDRLARRMGIYPSRRSAGSWRSWLKIWLSPASTLHYADESYDAAFIARQPIHSPAIITLLLLLIKLADLAYAPIRAARGRRHAS